MLNYCTTRRSALAAALLASAAGLHAQFSYTETFANGTAAGWNFYSGNSAPGPRLTSGAAPTTADPEWGQAQIDAAGQGWLRLATTTANQSNAAYFDTALPSRGNDITVRFGVALWGDRGEAAGGDGLTFFMRDASQAFTVGAFGGSIGYAQKSGIDGVSGGYFGVALDVYGNYSNPTEGRIGGVGFRPNAVVVRGPGNGQSGYDYLAGTSGYDFTATGSATVRDGGDPAISALPYSLSQPTATSRPNQTTLYRNVEITLTSTDQLTVRMQFGEDGLWRDLLTADMSSFARPDMMAFGFSSGTGGANQVYEIGRTFSVQATAADNTYFWDRGANSNTWSSGAAANWVGDSTPGAGANIMFNDAYVSSNQTVNMTGNRTVGSMYFSGQRSYTLTSDTTSRRLTFDAASGPSHLALTNSPTGNQSHQINTDVYLGNELIVENYVANQSLTFGDVVNTQGNDLTVKGVGTTVFSGAVSGGGDFVKQGTGTLEFETSAAVSSLTLSGGTLFLDSASITSTGALTISSNSVIDFGTSAASGSTLNFGSLAIAAGVTLTITNWTNALDFFYVTNQPTASALSQIVFAGWNGPVGWDSFTKQIRPVPEPSTYGLILGSVALAGYGLRRMRDSRKRGARANETVSS
jgi:fibronectin-binding autotransporter adhesin